jgi:DNA polymerase III epsilon subunit-like protein
VVDGSFPVCKSIQQYVEAVRSGHQLRLHQQFMVEQGSHFLAIDVETGGLDSSSCALLSIAAVLFDSQFRIEKKWHAFLLPFEQKLILPQAIAINGYTPEGWKRKGAIPLRIGLSALRNWILCLPTTFIPIAHSASFDASFLAVAELDADIKLGLPERWLCSKQAFRDWRHTHSHPGDNSLDSLCKLMCWPRNSTHDALEDAIICGKGYGWLTTGRLELSDASPLSSYILPCGEHKGELLQDVHPQHLTWLVQQRWLPTEIKSLVESYLNIIIPF